MKMVIGGRPTGQSREQRMRAKGAIAMKKFCARFWRDEQGQDLIEYTLMLAFVALVEDQYATEHRGG